MAKSAKTGSASDALESPTGERGGSGRRLIFLTLRELFAHQPLLQRADLVDHQDTVQVIGLVLDGDGQKPGGFELERLARGIERADAHVLGTLDLFTDTGER